MRLQISIRRRVSRSPIGVISEFHYVEIKRKHVPKPHEDYHYCPPPQHATTTSFSSSAPISPHRCSLLNSSFTKKGPSNQNRHLTQYLKDISSQGLHESSRPRGRRRFLRVFLKPERQFKPKTGSRNSVRILHEEMKIGEEQFPIKVQLRIGE